MDRGGRDGASAVMKDELNPVLGNFVAGYMHDRALRADETVVEVTVGDVTDGCSDGLRQSAAADGRDTRDPGRVLRIVKVAFGSGDFDHFVDGGNPPMGKAEKGAARVIDENEGIGRHDAEDSSGENEIGGEVGVGRSSQSIEFSQGLQ